MMGTSAKMYHADIAQIERWISEVNARGKDAVALPPSRRINK
jgi:hypothetical protein